MFYVKTHGRASLKNLCKVIKEILYLQGKTENFTNKNRDTVPDIPKLFTVNFRTTLNSTL